MAGTSHQKPLQISGLAISRPMRGSATGSPATAPGTSPRSVTSSHVSEDRFGTPTPPDRVRARGEEEDERGAPRRAPDAGTPRGAPPPPSDEPTSRAQRSDRHDD